jgi:hypothetical protein
MKAALQLYTGTTEEWELINPQPYDSVLCIEVRADGSRRFKLGNGKDWWNDLEYVDAAYIEGLAENLDALAVSIADEEARARLEEGALQENIDHEAEARSGADEELQQNLGLEAEARGGADIQLAADIAGEEERAMGVEGTLQEAAAAAQETADDNNIESGVLEGEIDSLKITLTKAGGETVEVSLADLKDLFLRRSAANGNGSTNLNNDPANDGFSALSTETDTNSIGGLETNTEAGNPVVTGMYLKHNVNPEDNVRILLMNNGVTKRAYLLKDKAVPAVWEDIDAGDELWNKQEVEDAINSAVAGIAAGLKMPIPLDLESELPPPAEAEAGDYYRISNMDESAPNHSGEAWFNPDVSTSAWQKTINTAFAPDGVTLELNGDGELAIRADVQALIDGAVQKGQLIEPYTYLVDSNAKLAAWAANTAGNDYTSVLIAAGTWTSAVEVNLTTSGTKVVAGMPGSKLVFTSQYGLRYTTLPTTNDYRMDGVNVEANRVSGVRYAFFACTHLTNCTGTADSSGAGSGYGFYGCTNLTDCTGTGSNGGSGIYNCLNLTNCTAMVTGAGTGFRSCTNLTNCTSTSTGATIGFNNCANLTNCTGTGTGAPGYGFFACINLTNCTGTGTGTGSAPGYGFAGCKGMLLNKPGSASTTATYNSCYVSISGTGEAPADTAAGGWNKV